MLRDIFEGIAYLFEEILFYPLDLLRDLELESWWAANALNFIFILVGLAAFAYWMKQLKHYNDIKDDDRDPTAHSFLG
ncbi:DUF6341 family protein [Salegentibacter mishustinae]|jgi:hypothetical protein|uniref:Uracil phosphoribosyltransferase n=1 Tax=Salegentibacter mishustinae TaxID=270918 RepID=A0A0Q9ZA70_9FLAO|nr:hypothetical protein [Salegentibacter mishustinae]KRG29917.1 uracil phosphoribosyltransferase [Salegentibacter mishustinae]MDX1427118.1 uracil phosphoribosyltransferase [Salegentibacter mishustinae]MDX1719277.1 uracil phosphoribosyltransferase [Salegentibacter mishustinae]PNW20674.1 uracil phosphoribosyltransferase [Salegentibacter mishustinae]PZX61686.1 hypothetical protein LY54_03046 [Salegentibacter mishustinae]|tara:strand:- start:94 stop:327 length:234 start_codon:yes stop_codon:yes gene_type:complete